MPRQKHTVPEQYLKWLEYVPESQREEAKNKWLAGEEGKSIANLAGGMNQAQREAAHYKQQAEYGQQLASSLSAYQDILPNLHHYANDIRRHTPEEIRAALGGAPQQQQQQVQAAIVGNEQQQHEIVRRMQARDLDWSEGQDELLRLRGQHDAMQSAVQKANTYIEHEVPQLITRVQHGFETMDNRRRADNLEQLRFNAKHAKYFQAHPDRDPEELIAALEQNPAGFQNFDGLVSAVYGEDDVDARIERARAEERTKVKTELESQRTTAQPPGEGWFNTGDNAVIRRRRASEKQDRPQFPRNDAEASEQLREFFSRRGGAGQAA